ncbi:hypothetical protein CCHR01_12169 [Colletotrichum chrysophilum]|uniref:Uncharacterized protein n=1 Tax=Colletotrichum chrysophilum TaxID=1836956 RepID=A0AAD9ABS3_9PEZI|nr:hypothetical protein CCHR01_12169 [Colletotrichum chrysophilum]
MSTEVRSLEAGRTVRLLLQIGHCTQGTRPLGGRGLDQSIDGDGKRPPEGTFLSVRSQEDLRRHSLPGPLKVDNDVSKSATHQGKQLSPIGSSSDFCSHSQKEHRHRSRPSRLSDQARNGLASHAVSGRHAAAAFQPGDARKKKESDTFPRALMAAGDKIEFPPFSWECVCTCRGVRPSAWRRVCECNGTSSMERNAALLVQFIRSTATTAAGHQTQTRVGGAAWPLNIAFRSRFQPSAPVAGRRPVILSRCVDG